MMLLTACEREITRPIYIVASCPPLAQYEQDRLNWIADSLEAVERKEAKEEPWMQPIQDYHVLRKRIREMCASA